MTLVAHLCGDFVFAGRFGEFANLVDRMGQRFLAIDMLAAFHGRHDGHIVSVVRGCDNDGVDIFFHFVEHDAKITIDFRPRILVDTVFGSFHIGIAQGNDVFTFYTSQVTPAAAANADGCYIQLVTRCAFAQDPAGNNIKGKGRRGRSTHKGAT